MEFLSLIFTGLQAQANRPDGTLSLESLALWATEEDPSSLSLVSEYNANLVLGQRRSHQDKERHMVVVKAQCSDVCERAC